MGDESVVPLQFRGRELSCAPGETVLECLERHGMSVVSSCRAGTCQTCLLRATDGEIPPKAQQGLKAAWKALGYVLPCVCTPTGPMTLVDPEAESIDLASRVVAKDWLAPEVVRLRLTRPGDFDYFAGQYVSLVRVDGLARPYSLASVPDVDDALELHVRIVDNGRMTGWIRDELQVGDPIMLRGPAGRCVYVAADADRPLVLVGTGTGLAPLLGVLRDALHQGHRGPIRLLHGSRRPAGLYLFDELRSLEGEHAQLDVTGVVLEGGGHTELAQGDLAEVLKTEVPSFANSVVYLCGNPAMVARLKRQVFLAGASMRDIHSDPFLSAAEGGR